ncbi:MAG: TetR/AcrR family transcriptional regulator [Cyanothece sp. SIO1E1]|nr:TetR/AcrR family transcriptional regulator [Cyanothece sp. SIO1E1]
MAGVKQFDQTDVLDRAMTVFWQRGYEATSIRDLTAATGLGRGSLYGAFGDKEGLFLAVLDHYEQSIQAQLGACLQNTDPKVAIASLFEQMVTRMSTGIYPAGCLNTNTTLECPSESDLINRTIAERLGKIESSIYEVLLRAQTQGSLPVGVDIRALSRFFLAISQGIAVLNKTFADPSVIKDVAKVINGFWDDIYSDR